jgi:hypothetical protein
MGRTKKACDQCHDVKEKCRWIHDLDSCERCHRLQRRCQSLRLVATAGRKPRYQRAENAKGHQQLLPENESSPSVSSPGSSTAVTTRTIPKSETVSFPRTLSFLVDLCDRELQILKGISHGQPRIGQFLVAPSFRICHHKAFARHVHTGTPHTQDALLATAALLACEYEPEHISENRTIGHKRAASAVSTLRSVRTLSSGDLSTVLLLAVSAVTFALHIDGNALVICRHSLNVIKPVYESSMELDSDCLAFVICLLYTEMVECLFRCEVPTVRFKEQRPEAYVDRYLGIASPLLPYLYDVCSFGYALRHGEGDSKPEIMEALNAVELAVEEWSPSLPEGWATRFLQEETISILGQAKVFRWSILLLAHRLRHPYSTETLKGETVSDAILEELDMIIRNTGRSVPCLNIAYMVACFELNDSKKRQMALDELGVVIGYSKQVHIKLRKQLAAFWSMKDTQDQVHWCDMIPRLPQ